MNKRYISLIEKNDKGKIIKNSTYELDELFSAIRTGAPVEDFKIGKKHISLINILGRKKFCRILENTFLQGYISQLEIVEKFLNHLINKDNVGKTKKVTKKKVTKKKSKK